MLIEVHLLPSSENLVQGGPWVTAFPGYDVVFTPLTPIKTHKIWDVSVSATAYSSTACNQTSKYDKIVLADDGSELVWVCAVEQYAGTT